MWLHYFGSLHCVVVEKKVCWVNILNLHVKPRVFIPITTLKVFLYVCFLRNTRTSSHYVGKLYFHCQADHIKSEARQILDFILPTVHNFSTLFNSYAYFHTQIKPSVWFAVQNSTILSESEKVKHLKRNFAIKFSWQW